ncbi:MAG: signal peptidase I [Actinobacteria bacterium]|nr:signal peptidase I [Actinomycetota bacterium]
MRDNGGRVDYRYQQQPGGYPPYPPGQPGYPQGPAYPPGPPQPPGPPRQRFLEAIGLSGWRIWLLIPFLILLMLFLIIIFVGRPYIVRGSSMQPTLREGDRVFVVKYSFGTTPDRGDVVVLKNVRGADEMLIKRAVAIAGDQVTSSDGTLVVNGKYRHRNTNSYVSTEYSLIVPDGFVFVMGDNEAHSYDSRSFGPIPVQDVVGKAFAIFWPPGDLKKL